MVAEDAPVEVDEASWAAARARRVETARRLSFMVCVDAMRCDAVNERRDSERLRKRQTVDVEEMEKK